MNIVVNLEDSQSSYLTGGEYAIQTLEIYIDKNLPTLIQSEMMIHSIIENYCGGWPHDKVEELTSLIHDGIVKLKEEKERYNQKVWK